MPSRTGASLRVARAGAARAWVLVAGTLWGSCSPGVIREAEAGPTSAADGSKASSAAPDEPVWKDHVTETAGDVAVAGSIATVDGDGTTVSQVSSDREEADGDPLVGDEVVFGDAVPPLALRRLTQTQYAGIIGEVLGVDAEVSRLQWLSPLNGLQAIAASRVTMAEVDVEAAGQLAQDVAAAVGQRLDEISTQLDCGFQDEVCIDRFLDRTGRRLFRRPLSMAERERLRALYSAAVEVSGEPAVGLEFVVAAILQSPHFLYRVELGATAAEDSLDAYGLAARLSFFLWNTAPDDELLDAADTGELLTEIGLRVQVDRLLASERVADGVNAFFNDWLELDRLEQMVKLSEEYPQASNALSLAMREETLRFATNLVLERQADARTLFTARETYVDQDLAMLYGLDPPAEPGFSATVLPESGGRSGLLTQASFLSLHSHPESTSPTLRGKFIREKLLCHAVPSPPADVSATLSDASLSPTARERLARHREDPACAACHALMDPLGLALEQFDGIGAFRSEENGVMIDASGELAGRTFEDAQGLGAALAAEPAAMACLATTVLRYARGALEEEDETPRLQLLHDQFAAGEYKVMGLLRAIALSPTFTSLEEW